MRAHSKPEKPTLRELLETERANLGLSYDSLALAGRTRTGMAGQPGELTKAVVARLCTTDLTKAILPRTVKQLAAGLKLSEGAVWSAVGRSIGLEIDGDDAMVARLMYAVRGLDETDMNTVLMLISNLSDRNIRAADPAPDTGPIPIRPARRKARNG